MESKHTDTHLKTTKINAEENILYHIAGPNLGLIYTLLHSFCFSLPSVMVKKMTYVSPSQLTLVRMGGSLVLCFPILVFTRQNWMGPREHRLLIFARGFANATSIFLSHLAYRLLPLAEAAIILATLPAVVVIGARLFLKETLGLAEGFALILAFVGILVSMNIQELFQDNVEDRFTAEYLGGIAAALAGICSSSCNSLVTRKLKDVHFSVFMIYGGVIGVIENIFLTAVFSAFELRRCGWDSLLMICIGILGFASLSFSVLAIQCELVSIVSVVSCSMKIVFGLVFQLIFFSHVPSVHNYCGAFLVVISACLIGLTKWMKTQPSESECRRHFKFLLL